MVIKTRIAIPVLLAACTFGLWFGRLGIGVEQQAKAKDVNKPELDWQLKQKEPVVFSVKDVRQGTRVTSDMVEVRQMFSKEVPGGVLWTTELAVGLIAKHGFRKGTMLTTYHFGLDDSDPQFRAGIGEGCKRMDRAMRRKVEWKNGTRKL